VDAGVQLLREISRQPVGQKGLHPLTLDGQVKTRQQQKEDRQGDQDYFPAFFDNFAFSQKYTKTGQISRRLNVDKKLYFYTIWLIKHT